MAELSHDVQALTVDLPLWVSVDQEGGQVARLREPFTRWPAMRAVGRCGDAEVASRFAAALARVLTAVGVSLDYAPVLDVDTNPDNPVIGDRALSDDADTVARLGTAIISALQAGGVAACGKHFPGHGDTSLDSHKDLPVVEHGPDRLRDIELAPFRAAAAAGAAMLMTAHVVYPSLDDARPATLSPRIATDLLRDEIEFGGVLASDDLGMQAIARGWTVEQAAVAAVAAGCDHVLLCAPDANVQTGAIEALIHAVEEGTIPEHRVERALDRIRRVKGRFLSVAPDWRPPTPTALAEILGCDDHRRLADRLEQYV